MANGRHATIYPLSLLPPGGHRMSSQRPVPHEGQWRPHYSSNYSFEVDSKDENLKNRLRRKSFTGESPHPILRQISGGKVNIPVQHVEDDSDDDIDLYGRGPSKGQAAHPIRIAQPEKAQSVNNARKQEVMQIQKPVSTTKLEPFDRQKELFTSSEDEPGLRKSDEYDPRKYEEQWSIESNLPSHQQRIPDGYDAEVNKKLGKALAKLGEELQSNRIKEESGKTSIREDHETEIRLQDEFMKKHYKLQRFYIVPDGNCLYRAVAQAILLDQSQHLSLRQLAVDHIRERKDEFKDIIEGDIDVFLSAAQLEGEWAGYPEILALSRLLDININITTGGTTSNPNVHMRVHYFAPTDRESLTEKDKDQYTQRESIWLSWLSNGHYDAFTDKPMENSHYNDWLQSRNSRIRSDAAMANQIHLNETTKIGCSDDTFGYNNEPICFKKDDSEKMSSPIKTERSPEVTRRSRQDINDWYTPEIHAALKSSVEDLCDRSSPRLRCDHIATKSAGPHKYPAPTFSNNTSGSARKDRPPPYSSLSNSTEHDEEIARNLQKEEDEVALRQFRYHLG